MTEKLRAALAALFLLVLFPCASFAQNSYQRGRALPPTNVDGFIKSAGGAADQIYGDEGEIGLPPIDSFTKANRINRGIAGINDAGLTTGHGSLMPDAWGADEFIAAPGEWSLAGANYGNYNYNNAAQGLDAAGQLQRLSLGQVSVGGPAPIGFPPPPGAGYQAVFTHGVFDGYLSPQEVSMWQKGNAVAAWLSYSAKRPGGPTLNDFYIVTREMGGIWK